MMDDLERINLNLSEEQILELLRGLTINFIISNKHIILSSNKPFVSIHRNVIRELFNNRNSPFVIADILYELM